MMTYFDMSQLSRGASAIGRMVQEHEDEVARLQADLTAALARAEAAEAEAAEARATNEALAELAASETERRVALAERVAELEAALVSADDETASASAQAARFWRTNNKLAERVAELEAQLEEATQLPSIAIDRLPEEEQEIVALRWALSGTFTNELPTIAAPAPQEPTP